MCDPVRIFTLVAALAHSRDSRHSSSIDGAEALSECLRRVHGESVVHVERCHNYQEIWRSEWSNSMV